MSRREDYQKGIAEKLELFHARATSSKTRAVADGKAEDATRLDELLAGGVATATLLAKLEHTSGDAWDALKQEVETSWQKIEAELEAFQDGGRARADGVTVTTAVPVASAARAAVSTPPVKA